MIIPTPLWNYKGEYIAWDTTNYHLMTYLVLEYPAISKLMFTRRLSELKMSESQVFILIESKVRRKEIIKSRITRKCAALTSLCAALISEIYESSGFPRIPMDDEPMWAADRVVAPTLGSAITIPETANEFVIKGGGIFLYKTPNQAYQLLEDKVLLKLDWAKNQKPKSSLKKTVAFTNEGSSNSDTDKIMARMDAMTMKMDAQYKEMQPHLLTSNLVDLLNNLDKMLQHFKDANLVLNWEKCHFMVKEGIMLGHKVSGAGIEVDKAKIDVISKLPPLLRSKALEVF
ncbi:hypothetical protein Tco_1049545 [Tanacetum coccineum]